MAAGAPLVAAAALTEAVRRRRVRSPTPATLEETVPRLSLHRGPEAISPTAHYTGHTWVRHRLSHPGLATWEGRVLFDAMEPAMALSRAVGGPTLEGLLVARHRIIDHLLERAIEDGRVTQVVEPACGMSPRGWRLRSRHGDRLTYVEADLPEMAERKRRALARMGALGPRHRVAELDVLRDGGEASVARVAEGLDPRQGVAIVTEGLLTYLDDHDVVTTWERFATALRRFPTGLYLADLRLAGADRGRSEEAFGVVLGLFVRGRVHRHFASEEAAAAALRAAGFGRARLHRGDAHPATAGQRPDPGSRLIHVIEAAVP